MAGEKKPTDQPCHVRLVGVDGGPGFVHGVESDDAAKADAKERNARAEQLGIAARYEAVASYANG